MNIAVAYVVLPLLFALFYRCRGGPFSFKYWLTGGTGGTFWARLIWWATTNAIAFASTTLSFFGLLAGPMAFLGLLIPHAKEQDGQTIDDYFVMSLILFGRALLVAAPLAFFVSKWCLLFSLFGLLAGPCYWVGNNIIKDRIKITGRIFGPLIPEQWRDNTLITSGGEAAETLVGFFWGLGIGVIWRNFL